MSTLSLPAGPNPGSRLPALPALMHDVRGAATAIEALASLVRADLPGSEPLPALLALEARAQQLGALCDAMALLQGRPEGRLPLSQILPVAVARLQKLLDAAGITLKSPGEIPDKEWEGRSLAVLLQAVLVTAANAREAGPAEAVLRTEDDVHGDTRIVIELRGSGWRPAAEAVAALARSGDAPLACAARRALDGLGASLGVEPVGPELAIVIALPRRDA